MKINSRRVQDCWSHLGIFIPYTRIWLQNVSARIGNCQVLQNLKKNKKNRCCFRFFESK